MDFCRNALIFEIGIQWISMFLLDNFDDVEMIYPSHIASPQRQTDILIHFSKCSVIIVGVFDTLLGDMARLVD